MRAIVSYSSSANTALRYKSDASDQAVPVEPTSISYFAFVKHTNTDQSILEG